MVKHSFHIVFFHENMIICVINYVKKIWIFFGQSQIIHSFIHLNDVYVLNGSHVHDTSLVGKGFPMV